MPLPQQTVEEYFGDLSPQTFEEALDSVLAEMREVMIAKNRDYSSQQADNIGEFGELGVLIRANDKMARLKNLLYHSKHEPKNESVDDSFLDLGNYAVIALMLRRQIWGLPHETTLTETEDS